MATRAFRTDASIAAELATRRRVEPLLERHGFEILDSDWIERGSAITQIITARRGDTSPMRMHVRLCWRRDGRNARENLYSAAQLRARLIDGDWEKTLETIAAREARDGNSHLLLVQDSADGDRTHPAIYFSVSAPAQLPLGEIHAALERATAGFEHRLCWARLAESAGIDVDAQRALVERYGL